MQPPSRMTFKFDGNLPREVRNDSAVRQDSALQASGQGSANADLADPAARGFKPRGFSAQASRQAQSAGSGYRLPGKGAHIGQGRPVPDTASGLRMRDAAPEGGAAAPIGAQQSASAGNGPAAGRHPSDGHMSDARSTREHPIRPQSAKRPADRVARSGPYQDDVEALEQMIRGTDGERGHPRSESRSQSSERVKTLPAGRVAGFRKPSSVQAPSLPDLPYGDLRHAIADQDDQEVYPSSEVQDPYAAHNHSAAYDAGSVPLDSEPYSDVDEHWIDGGNTRRYRGGPSWMRIFASVAAAIVTGAIFGYIVLALFTGEPILPSGSAADPASAGLKPAASGAAAASDGTKADPAASGQAPAGKPDGTDPAGAAQPDKAAGAAGDAQVPASVSYLLQYGVFQSEASMNEAVQALTSQGIAAATDTKDGYRVYAGIAADKAEAEKLAAALTDEELYAKALDNRALSLPQTPAAVSWAAYLKESDALGRLLAGTSAELLAEGDSPPPSAQAAADMQAALKRWNAAKTDMASWSGSRSEPAGALAAQLGAASEQWAAYGKEPSAARLRAVQTSAMKAALIARQLREELGEDGD
ncbi:Sporulation related domain-containing protein [Cohnella sp. OV330]|uniref:SPOR domain-containing protein n=1 Tax=Cohnella sp. OV330 TaxID=1855288 RepID=UPI0008F23A8C|nr:SPOR domain-containing protein [Cohnella sp. OV330]SFB40268.1 Sporulation related domain-containing protein [Cohnella sp. OV330]